MALIETVNIFQNYDGRDILKNINLKIDRAEIFALIGPTGAGKTTLIRILNLLEPPYSGRVFFDGVDVTNPRIDQLEARRRMSYVQQKPLVFTMNVYDNIACGLRWRHMESAAIKRKTEEALELVGMTSYKNRNARTLSGGETQCVAIARALVTEPAILFLDEPTANLDPISTSKVEQVIYDAIREKKVAVVMATHDMIQGQQLATRIGVLLDGQIQQAGAWHEVFNSPLNREIAGFVGMENIVDGTVVSNEDKIATVNVNGNIVEAISDFAAGTEVSVCVRPEDVTVSRAKISSSARNSFAGEITRTISMGPLVRVEIDCGFPLVSLVTKRSAGELNLVNGEPVYATFKATVVHVIRR